MTDTATPATPAADSGGSGNSGSEFSKPTGVNDEAVWNKHFGKDSKEPKGARSKESSRSESKDSRSTSEKTPSEKTSSDSRESKPSERKSSSARTDEPEKKPPSDSKGEGSASSNTTTKDKADSKKGADSEATGQKTAEDKADPADPEEPSKKAKDLYDSAKKADDPREARKLYKRALKEAFGEVPPEFDDSQYAAVRKERKAAKAALDAQGEKNEGRIREAAEKLKPAIYVMRQLEGAGLDQKLTVPLVEKAIHVIRALKGLEDGDYSQLAEVVARASGTSHDEAMKNFVRGVKISPEGRAARQVAEEAGRRAQQAEARVQELERKLTERDTQQTEAQKRAEHQQRVAEHRERYVEQIGEELSDHPVMKLPRGAERVMAYLIKTADPKLRSPTVSFETAANRIVAHERKRLQQLRVLDSDGEETTPPNEPRRLTAVSRTETRDAGVRSEDPEASFDRIYTKHTSAGGRKR